MKILLILVLNIKILSMGDFAEFKPVSKNIAKEAVNYYNQNNLPFPDNDYFSKYIAQEGAQDVPIPMLPEQVAPKLPTKPAIKSNNITTEIMGMDINDMDKEYLTKLAQKESSFRPFITNNLGYYGLYQFGDLAFKDVGYTKESFKNTLNQHKAALKLAKLNEGRLKDVINNYSGKEFNGIKITKNGIRAAAHLLGAKSVKDWFSNKSGNYADANGTRIEDYLRYYSA